MTGSFRARRRLPLSFARGTAVPLAAARLLLAARTADAPAPLPAVATIRSVLENPNGPSKAAAWEAIRQVTDPSERRQLARQLAALLREPAMDLEDKTLLAQLLAVLGTAAEVPALAALLHDPATVDTARLALESIPDPAAGQALRDALARLEGQAMIGVLHSLAARRDAEALPTATDLVPSSDPTLVRAALHLLGEIGTEPAARGLARAQHDLPRELQAAGWDAQLACASQLAATGQHAVAAAIFQGLLASSHPTPVRLGALRGLALTAPTEAVPAVLAALRDPDESLAAGATALSALLPGETTTRALAAALEGAPASSASSLLQALADRRDPAALPVVLSLLESPLPPVRLAAIAAVGTLGDANSVDRLLPLATGSDRAASQAALKSLERLHASGVEERLTALATQGPPTTRALALTAVANRRQPDAKTVAWQGTASAEAPVRVAAWNALTPLASPNDFGPWIARACDVQSERESLAALAALQAAGHTLTAEARLAEIASALPQAQGLGRQTLLQAASTVGGAAALDLVRPDLVRPDPITRTTALRLLADWPDPSAAPDLFRLATAAPEPGDRELAARGFFRLAETSRQESLLRQGAQLATSPERKRLWLSALANAGQPASLELALAALADPAVQTEAALAALKIAEGLLKSDPDTAQTVARRIAQASPTPDLLQQANALARRAEAPVDVLQPYPPSVTEARRHALRQELGQDTLLAYLDCGVHASDGPETGPRLAQLTGQPWFYSTPADSPLAPFASVAFDGQSVRFALRGLDPQKRYAVGFSWSDYDANGRVQSVDLLSPNGRVRRLVDQQALPKHARDNQPPTAFRAVLDPADYPQGQLQLGFQRQAGPNATVSEVWLCETDPSARPSLTSRPAFTPPPTPPLDLDPPAADIKVLIVTGVDYPGHPWPETAPALKKVLEQDPRIRARIVEDPAVLASPKLDLWDAVVIHFMDWEIPGPGPEARENLRRYVAAGHGLALTHFACGAWDNHEWPEFRRLAGRVWDPKLRGHDPHGTFRVEIADPDHPIVKGMQPFETVDELYTCLAGEVPIHVVAKATSKVDHLDYPMAFVLPYGQGRVFHCVLGHDARAYVSPGVGELLRRGLAWAAAQPPTP